MKRNKWGMTGNQTQIIVVRSLSLSCMISAQGSAKWARERSPGRSFVGEANMTESPLRVFINYRHEDTWGEAMLLYDRLAGRFGSENVFLDARSLRPSMEWLEEIKSQAASSAVFLSLIGPRWAAIMKERAQQIAHPSEDYVRFEIEYVLGRRRGIRVIPVLVGDHVPFTAAGLPRALRPLTAIETEYVRPKRFEEDLAHLIATLETVSTPDTVTTPETIEQPSPPEPHQGEAPPVPPPDDEHYHLVLRHMVDEGNLVPFLGSRLAGRRAGPAEAPGPAPDADEIAAYLAERFAMKPMARDLPVVAQYVYLTRGRPDLYIAIRQILTAEHEPGPVHRFLARFPQRLAELGAEQRYQLIVSTSFDTGLERAFDEAREPYDLAVFMASGPDKGKFVHFPYDGSPEAISVPNAYGKFPIADYGELERTVIVKIHGAVDGHVGDFSWKENYVITEDHYIDYLSRSPIENLVPVQILDKLRDSHCLFLGYTMREWYLRVFLKRIWRGEPLDAESWAIEPEPDVLEKKFWRHSYVDLYAASLAEYVNRLDEFMDGHAPGGAEP
jgi:SIR2-like domain/TIR domain